MEFEWDEDKAAANLRKHGISFAEASTAFADDLSLTGSDPDHSRVGASFCHFWRIICGKVVGYLSCRTRRTYPHHQRKTCNTN